METQNTMEEKKTITIEEVEEAINLLRTFAEQHEDSALLVVLHSGPNVNLSVHGRGRDIIEVLCMYAVRNGNIRDILLAVTAILKDDSEEGQKYRDMLKTVLNTGIKQ